MSIPADDALDRLDADLRVALENLARVRAEMERLCEERDEARRSCDLLWGQLQAAQRGFRERESAEAEVRRLTEGLRDIEQDQFASGSLLRRKARALLAASPPDGGGAK